jgi:mannosyltransferase
VSARGHRDTTSGLHRDGPEPGLAREWRTSDSVLVCLSLCIAAALRFWHLGQQSLWADEFASLLNALLSLAEIPAQALRHDAFEPPLYFWLLHGVIRTAGSSEWALRLLSALAGTATIPVVWLLIRDLIRRPRIANTTALLLATNPLHVWYSQEARPYALLVLLGSAALLCLVRALDRDGAWWVGFVAFSAAAMLTHVTGVVYPVVGGLWALHTRGARVLGRLALAAAGTFALTLPFFISLAYAVRHAEGTGSPERPFTGLEVPYSVFTFLGGYSFGPPVRELQDLGWRVAVANHPAQTLLASATLLWLIALLLRPRRLPIIQVGLLFVVPLAAATAGSLLSTKAYNVRYVLPALVGFLGLMAIAMERPTPRGYRVGLAMVLGLFLWSDAQWFWSRSYWKDDSRAAAACLAMGLTPGSTVAVAPSYMRLLVAYYLPQTSGIRVVGINDVAGLEASHANALAITRPSHVAAPATELVRSLEGGSGYGASRRQVVGYRLYFVPKDSGAVLDGDCQVSGPASQ